MSEKSVVLVLEEKNADRLCWRKRNELATENREAKESIYDEQKLITLVQQLKEAQILKIAVLGEETNNCLQRIVKTLADEGISVEKVIPPSKINGYVMDEYIFSAHMMRKFDIFKRKWITFCPFIYKTIYIDLDGGMDFCPLCVGNRNIYGSLLPQYKPNRNWNKENM